MKVYRYKGGVAKYIYKLSRGITVDKYWYNGIGQTSPDHTRPVYGETQSRYENPPRAEKNIITIKSTTLQTLLQCSSACCI